MNKLVCPNCYSTSSVHHHTDWKHIDNHTGETKPVSIRLCLDCKTLFIDDRIEVNRIIDFYKILEEYSA